MGHEELRDALGARSMADLSTDDLQKFYRGWSNHNLRQPRARRSELPRRGYGKQGQLEMVSAEDLETLAAAFSRRGWGDDTRRNFIRRQLSGRQEIRTRADFHKVFSGVRAMNRREGV